jgi:hypothetical protein
MRSGPLRYGATGSVSTSILFPAITRCSAAIVFGDSLGGFTTSRFYCSSIPLESSVAAGFVNAVRLMAGNPARQFYGKPSELHLTGKRNSYESFDVAIMRVERHADIEAAIQ